MHGVLNKVMIQKRIQN